MGVGPDGFTGPASFIDTKADMVEAEQWSEMGVSIDHQCSVISETCRRQRSRDLNWMPRTFRYFTGAMKDRINSHSKSSEVPYTYNLQGETVDQKRTRWRKNAKRKRA